MTSLAHSTRGVRREVFAAVALGCAAPVAGVPPAPARLVREITPDHQLHPRPRFLTVAPHLAREGELYLYGFQATEFEGDEVEFTLVRAPEGASLEGRLLKWVPTHAQAGHRQWFTLRAMDDEGEYRDQAWALVPRPEPIHQILAGPRTRH